MKDLIKKILKEETSDLKPALIKAFYSFMEMETQGYEIYVDTPENRFEYTPESIWIINPKTKEWVIELENSGRVWCYNRLYDNFLMWFKEDESVFERLITIWVEDVIKRGVSRIDREIANMEGEVEDVLKRGMSTTWVTTIAATDEVEDVLKKGIKIS